MYGNKLSSNSSKEEIFIDKREQNGVIPCITIESDGNVLATATTNEKNEVHISVSLAPKILKLLERLVADDDDIEDYLTDPKTKF